MIQEIHNALSKDSAYELPSSSLDVPLNFRPVADAGFFPDTFCRHRLFEFLPGPDYAFLIPRVTLGALVVLL